MSTDAADGPRPGGAGGEAVYSVSRLNREARLLLEAGLGRIWVEAEVSNCARPSSGHWYFTLKDSGAQLRCAMFRQRNQYARCQPRDGQQVLARGRISLYEPRGDYQLIVEQLEEAGLGALQRAFEALRERLAAEGLFAPEIRRDRTTFVMGEIHFRFIGPAAYGDRIATTVTLTKIGDRTLHWACKARNAVTGAPVTEGKATRVFARINEDGTLNSAAIPDAIRKAMMQSGQLSHLKQKIEEDPEYRHKAGDSPTRPRNRKAKA